ncbi:DUF1178 family protein [Ruixingdingia sedimenti]|uniref:DUF1178 family protein n=1 Tax=Ruixingdingia sedimenti TaxID=3073604 RepID=A0ABU1F472_9RHOB|nr:DUF1178 family protein [Xinfangfangia sp. LG-4]MDR5651657.1 DUF1178 family protein [Xinfangfangia sp. LG-4]
MIRYDLKCDQGHGFDSWFQSAAAFDRLAAAGQMVCPACGSARVEKQLMAPAVTPARAPAADHPLSTPSTPQEQMLARLRRELEEKSEYVGMGFAAEARRMHEGETPERAIHGEARLEEARQLIEDGIPVAPLPFLPARKTN